MNRIRRAVVLSLFLLSFLILFQGCTSSTGSSTSSGGGGTSGNDWTVTVSPAQSTLPQSVSGTNTLSSTTVIIRVVNSSGSTPPNGQIVYLTCSNGAFGFQTSGGVPTYTQPITSTTAGLTQGQAIVTFTAGFSGPTTAVINATFQSSTGSATITILANPTT